ncbi:MAG: glycoside hydrolase family 127 protein [Sedimentisphaerales bacterium]|nr:glycoside hydrolase family 127 protein [Sedimentisphaerales bacterium]
MVLICQMMATNISDASTTDKKATSTPKVHMDGELGTRYTAAMANILIRPDRYSKDTFRSTATGAPGALWWDWPGDQLGRWLSLVHIANKNGWSTANDLCAMATDIALPLQNEKGYFGPDASYDQKDARLVSGNAFALRGLMDAYEDTGQERFLLAARRMRDYFEALFPHWSDNGDGYVHEFYGHCLDGLVKLYRLDGDEKAYDLAQRIARRLGRTHHTHHSLSMYRGALDLYALTRDSWIMAGIQDYLDWCREVRLVTGGLPESMPKSPQDEGCAEADYVVLNLKMFQVTGDMQYLDDAEHVLVNHFLYNQFYTGGFGHRKYTPDIIGGKLWQGWEGKFGSENPGCCSFWGAWALGQVGQYLITPATDGYNVNLYGQADIDFIGKDVRFTMDSDFPRCRRASLKIVCPQPATFALRLRIPDGADEIKVAVNDEVFDGERDGRRLIIKREWKADDKVTIELGGGLHLVSPGSKTKGQKALFDGPLCLALSSADADVATEWSLAVKDGKPIRNDAGEFQLTDGETIEWHKLTPIAHDWMSSDVKEPNRLRILFKIKEM